MIFDKIENAKKYYQLHPKFEKAFKYLVINKLTEMPLEKFEIEGEDLFVMFTNKEGKAKSSAKLEAHQKYADIQFLIAGNEQIGWKSHSDCKSVDKVYDADKDIEFFKDEPQTFFSLKPECFAIFFPEDAHAPMVGEGLIHKAVIKIKIK